MLLHVLLLLGVHLLLLHHHLLLHVLLLLLVRLQVPACARLLQLLLGRPVTCSLHLDPLHTCRSPGWDLHPTSSSCCNGSGRCIGCQHAPSRYCVRRGHQLAAG
jgi:hypothetical protein